MKYNFNFDLGVRIVDLNKNECLIIGNLRDIVYGIYIIDTECIIINKYEIRSMIVGVIKSLVDQGFNIKGFEITEGFSLNYEITLESKIY